MVFSGNANFLWDKFFGVIHSVMTYFTNSKKRPLGWEEKEKMAEMKERTWMSIRENERGKKVGIKFRLMSFRKLSVCCHSYLPTNNQLRK